MGLLAEVWAVAFLQVMADPEPLRVVHGEAVEIARVNEADLGGLFADGELAAGDAGGVADVQLAADLPVGVGDGLPGVGADEAR